MLTKRHVAFLRAALQFFDEELTPHGPEAVRAYFKEPLEGDLAAEEIRRLRELLRSLELRSIVYEPVGMRVVSQELLTAEQAQRISDIGEHRLATVLLTSGT